MCVWGQFKSSVGAIGHEVFGVHSKWEGALLGSSRGRGVLIQVPPIPPLLGGEQTGGNGHGLPWAPSGSIYSPFSYPLLTTISWGVSVWNGCL